MSLLYDVIRWLIGFFYKVFGDYGIAIVILTLIVRLCILPLSLKQRQMMKKQKILNKDAEEIRKKYRNNPDKMNAEIEKLYYEQRMDIGCIPPILQLPIMLFLYHGIRLTLNVNASTILLPWVPSLLTRDNTYILPLLTVCIQIFPQLIPYIGFFKKLNRKKMSPMMLFVILLTNAWFASMLPAGIGLYYFISSLYTALEQSVYALLERNKLIDF